MRSWFVLNLIGLAALASPVQSQPDQRPAGPPASTDFVSVGLLAGVRPTYNGSNNYVVRPLPSFRARLSGFDVSARGPGLFVDFVRENSRSEPNIILGPLVRARFDRSGDLNDAPVEALGERDIAVEVGGSAGVSFPGVLGRMDSITLQTDITADVAGAHDGVLIEPSLSYRFPLGPGAFGSVGASASWADNNYHDTYFSIDAAGSAASGLPAFDADGGFQDIGLSATAAIDLDGNIRNGGWGLFLLASYRRLIGDAADSPVVSIRGDADQFFGGAGFTYSF